MACYEYCWVKYMKQEMIFVLVSSSWPAVKDKSIFFVALRCMQIHQTARRTSTDITNPKNTCTYTSVERYQAQQINNRPEAKTTKDNHITATTLLLLLLSLFQILNCTISHCETKWLMNKLIQRIHQHTPWNSCFHPVKCEALSWPIVTHSTVFKLGSGRCGNTAMSCNYKSE